MRGFRCSSNSKSRDTSVPDSGHETRETKKKDIPKTTETPTEVTTESNDVAASGNSSYIGELKEQVKKNKTKIEELEQQLENHKHCFEIIKTNENEIKKLKDENIILKDELRTLKKDQEEMKDSYQWLETEHDREKEARISMKTKYDAKLKELNDLTGNKDLLCLRQLCVDVQVHMYKYVMQEDYDEIFITPDIDKIKINIEKKIKNKEKKTEAIRRLQILEKKKCYKDALECLETLIQLKKNGNITAHPKLNIEKIKQSIANLRKDNKLKDDKYEDVKKLATGWTESKLLLDSG